jgi:MraZ protein
VVKKSIDLPFNVIMINIVGTYECKIDSKARVMIPAALKKQLSPVLSNGFIIKRSVFSSCLELHPISEWNNLMLEVNKLNRFIKKNNDFIRLFTAGVKSIEADSTARIQLPKDLVSFAGIQKDIVLSSSVNMIEIWDKDKYEHELEIATPDFAQLAEDVMGDTQNLD